MRTLGIMNFFWSNTSLKGKSLLAIILKLAWNAFIYDVWVERNKKVFGKQSGTSAVLAQAPLHSTFADNSINKLLCQNWDIDEKMFD